MTSSCAAAKILYEVCVLHLRKHLAETVDAIQIQVSMTTQLIWHNEMLLGGLNFNALMHQKNTAAAECF